MSAAAAHVMSISFGRPFLFQANKEYMYHVAEDGVEVVQSRPLDGTIVAFVDGDPKNSDPQGFLTTSVSWSNPARALD